MGRPRKSKESKRRIGTARKDRDPAPPAAGANSPSTALAPPAWLQNTALEKWRELTGRLQQKRAVTRDDVEVIAIACMQWAIITHAYKRIQREGILVKGARGLVKHPALQIQRDATAKFLRCCEELGLSPMGRVRIGATDEEKEDPFFDSSGGDTQVG